MSKCETCQNLYAAIMAARAKERDAHENYLLLAWSPERKRQWENAKQELADWRRHHALHVQDRHQLRLELGG